MWVGSERNPLCASANEASGPLVNNAPLTQEAMCKYDRVVWPEWLMHDSPRDLSSQSKDTSVSPDSQASHNVWQDASLTHTPQVQASDPERQVRQQPRRRHGIPDDKALVKRTKLTM